MTEIANVQIKKSDLTEKILDKETSLTPKLKEVNGKKEMKIYSKTIRVRLK